MREWQLRPFTKIYIYVCIYHRGPRPDTQSHICTTTGFPHGSLELKQRFRNRKVLRQLRPFPLSWPQAMSSSCMFSIDSLVCCLEDLRFASFSCAWLHCNLATACPHTRHGKKDVDWAKQLLWELRFVVTHALTLFVARDILSRYGVYMCDSYTGKAWHKILSGRYSIVSGVHDINSIGISCRYIGKNTT